MLRAGLILGGLLVATSTRAAGPAPTPWEITGTSSVAAIEPPAVTHRLEHRRFQKNGRVALRAGATYLSRGDMRTNPGASVDIAWYLSEVLGVDLLSVTAFGSSLNSTAEALRKSTGLLPDSEKPLARLTAGARYSFAYGKALVERLDAVFHLDANAFAHLGVLWTDSSVNPAADLGLSLQVSFGQRPPDATGRASGLLGVLWIEAGWLVSYEDRTTSSVASGALGTIGVGLMM